MRLPRFRITERQFLLFILGGLMCAYCAAFLVTTIRRPTGPLKPKRGVRVHRLVEKNSDVIVSMFDPSLMSLPDMHGFSGALWERGPRLHQRETDWGLGPAFFEARSPQEIPLLVPKMNVETMVQRVARKTMAPIPEDEKELVSNELVFTNSTFVVISGLDGRLWREGKTLPVITNEIPVRPTQVRIGVNGEGNVRFAAIEEGSGNETADATALDAAYGLKFKPVGGAGWDGLVWGRVKALWVTVSPVSSKAVSQPAGAVPSP